MKTKDIGERIINVSRELKETVLNKSKAFVADLEPKLLMFIAGTLAAGLTYAYLKTPTQGEQLVIKVGQSNQYMAYRGMPSDKVFSVSERDDKSVNTYFSTSIKVFEYERIKYELVRATPESLVVKIK